MSKSGPMSKQRPGRSVQSKAVVLSPQQVRAIKQAPKGQLPAFIRAGVGRGPQIVSLGASAGVRGRSVGGSVGVSQGKPFVTLNVNGKNKVKIGQKKGAFFGQ